MTIRLPKGLYERLRREAFEKRVSQASIIVDAVTERLGYVTTEEESQNDAQGQ